MYPKSPSNDMKGFFRLWQPDYTCVWKVLKLLDLNTYIEMYATRISCPVNIYTSYGPTMTCKKRKKSGTNHENSSFSVNRTDTKCSFISKERPLQPALLLSKHFEFVFALKCS